jgi:hypothetical protein
MIATHIGTDFRRSPELPHDDHGAVLVKSPIMEILDERADALVEDREIFRFALQSNQSYVAWRE